MKSSEKRSSNAISALRRRFVGHSNSSHRRDRSIPEDDHSQIDVPPSETISADDILARYSNKGSISTDNSSKINTIADESHTETITVRSSHSNDHHLLTLPSSTQIDTDADALPYYDPNNLDTCGAFIDAKKKLRIVLASANTDSINYLHHPIHFSQYFSQNNASNGSLTSASSERKSSSSNYLILFLRSQLYEAIALQDRDLQAQLHETLRSIEQFHENECKEIVRSMIDDYRSRSVYIAYLVKNHENLLNFISHQNRSMIRIQR